jgi:hypothetical protein
MKTQENQEFIDRLSVQDRRWIAKNGPYSVGRAIRVCEELALPSRGFHVPDEGAAAWLRDAFNQIAQEATQ